MNQKVNYNFKKFVNEFIEVTWKLVEAKLKKKMRLVLAHALVLKQNFGTKRTSWNFHRYNLFLIKVKEKEGLARFI